MQLYKCQTCGQLLFFDNTLCVRCRSPLGYLPDAGVLSTLHPVGVGVWRASAKPGQIYRRCANADHVACNWLVPGSTPTRFCRACELNQLVPDLGNPANLKLWQGLERAKHQLVYALLRLKLPVASREVEPATGLAFVFVADPLNPAPGVKPLPTGHLNGVITINLSEADDAEREKRRKALSEPYRTLLGHFRHESGHYYWQRLVAGRPAHKEFRRLFGDEQADYGQSLKAYYRNGPAPDWQTAFVSAYGSAHPMEDFAETWAHYLHILDTLDTATAYGISVRPAVANDPSLSMTADFDPYTQLEFGRIIAAWLPLTYALNSLNHSMGHGQFYPFVLVPKVADKLRFLHALVRGELG